MNQTTDASDAWPEYLLDLDIADALDSLQRTGRASAENAHNLAEVVLIAAETDVSAARRYLAIADALTERLGRPVGVQAHLAYAQARVAVHTGDLSSAEDLLSNAQSQWQAAGDDAGVTRSLLGLTQVLAMQGRFDEAEAAVRTAITEFDQQEAGFFGRLRLASAYHNLATLYVVQELHGLALAEYARAADILDALLNGAATDEEAEAARVEQAHNALNRATALTYLDRPEEAEIALDEAIAGFSVLGDAVNRGRARTNLGRLLLRTGRSAAALAIFDAAAIDLLGQSVADVTDLEQLRAADELLLERATAQAALNLLPEAAQALTTCESLFRSAGQQLELAQTLYLRGLVDLRGETLSNAARPLEEALALFIGLGNDLWRNRCVVALAVLAIEQGQLDAAGQNLDGLLANAAVLSEDALSWDLSSLIDARLLRARIALDMADPARADAEITACATLLGMTADVVEQPAIYPQYVMRVLHARGRLARSQGRYVDALGDLNAAANLLERQRVELPLEEIRTAFLDDKSAVFTDLLLATLDAPDAGDEALSRAFDILERARSRSLLERLATSLELQADPDRAPTNPDRQRLEEVRRRLHWLYNRLLGDNGARHLDATLTQAMQTEEAALHDLLLRASPTLATVRPVELVQFQRHLEADVQALVFAAAGDELMIFVIDRTSMRVVRRVCSMRAVAAAQADLRFQMGRASLGADYLARNHLRLLSGVQGALQRLYELVVAPLTPLLHAGELLIAPTGSLHLLPFHALWDGERYLLERFVIRLTPSASLAVRCADQDRLDVKSAAWAGLAVTDVSIPAARQEVEVAARRFVDARLFVEEHATLAALHAGAQADILHIAAHGLYRSDNPFFSMLKLADGWVDVRALYQLPLTARLVVLSACESGVGLVRGGDEVIGLVRGFLGAGAYTVIASLWNVHDASAAHLMADFYEALVNGATPAAALRQAQFTALHSGQHPYFWASFFVIGA
jgi:CHAT domain-containing protein/tetratricopeptide (TPR) repeat protein